MLVKRLIALTLGLLSIGSTINMAMARPGCSVTVFWDANFGGEARTFHDDVGFVGRHWNDQISSFVVHQGRWVFFRDAGFNGETLNANPGAYAFVGNYWNDQISSARCIQPTR